MEEKPEIEEFAAYLQSRIQAGWHIVTSELENRGSKPITLLVEPFATDVVISPGSVCAIVAAEPDDHALHLTFSDEYVQVWACGLIETFQEGIATGTTGDFQEWRRKRQARIEK